MDGHAIQIQADSLHGRITKDLLRRVGAGQFTPGERLPTEAALCREYGVSRITVRRAMAVLVARGLVRRARGAGSFVTGRPADRREFHLHGFLDDKLLFDHQVQADDVQAADAHVAAALGIEPGAPVRHICSTVHRDGEPFTLTHAYTADLPDRRVSPADFRARVPSAAALGERLGRRITRAEQELDAVAADALAVRHLGVAHHAPLMRARRTYLTEGDQPIQHLVVLYHPDHYRFVVDLVPRTGAAAFQVRPGAKQPANQPVEEDTP